MKPKDPKSLPYLEAHLEKLDRSRRECEESGRRLDVTLDALEAAAFHIQPNIPSRSMTIRVPGGLYERLSRLADAKAHTLSAVVVALLEAAYARAT